MPRVVLVVQQLHKRQYVGRIETNHANVQLLPSFQSRHIRHPLLGIVRARPTGGTRTYRFFPAPYRIANDGTGLQATPMTV
jgi:hypothetical protein